MTLYSGEPPTPSRILLAEDDELFRAFLARSFANNGYQVIEVGDTAHMVAVLYGCGEDHVRDIDVLIAAAGLPRGSSLDIVAAINELPDRIPAVLLTACGGHELHHHARRVGALAIIEKPFALEQLTTLVSRMRSTPVAGAVPLLDAAGGHRGLSGRHPLDG